MSERQGESRHGLRVLVVDDDADLRRLVRMALEFHGGFRVVGEARDGASAVQLAAELRPDVVVLDLGLPDMHGLQVLGGISRLSPSSRVVVFSGLDDGGVETAALAGGASSYVLKGSDIAVLVRALEAVPPHVEEAITSFTPAPDSPAGARRFVRDFCLSWRCEEFVDGALLVASELVTNAVVHACTPCTLALRLRGEVLRLEVTDGSEERPSPHEVTAEAEDGRGLFIVAALATTWGIDPSGAGKTVWAELLREHGRHSSATYA